MILLEEQEMRGLFQNLKLVNMNAFPNGQGDDGGSDDSDDEEPTPPGGSG